MKEGETASDLYLVLDGVIRVDRDGAQLDGPDGLGEYHDEAMELADGADILMKLATGLRNRPVPLALAADGEVICL